MKTSDPYAEAYANAARAAERCQYHTPTGRQCACLILDPQSKFCPRHSESSSTDTQNFADLLAESAEGFQTPKESTIPLLIFFVSWPAATSPPAAPPGLPTSPACSSAPSPASRTNSSVTNPPSSR
jgi:hypothetical protein